MKLLEGKVAVVTGAARGIGKAIAMKFAQEGASVAFTDLKADENFQNTEKELQALGVKAKGYTSNAADFEDTAKVVSEDRPRTSAGSTYWSTMPALPAMA